MIPWVLGVVPADDGIQGGGYGDLYLQPRWTAVVGDLGPTAIDICGAGGVQSRGTEPSP